MNSLRSTLTAVLASQMMPTSGHRVTSKTNLPRPHCGLYIGLRKFNLNPTTLLSSTKNRKVRKSVDTT